MGTPRFLGAIISTLREILSSEFRSVRVDPCSMLMSTVGSLLRIICLSPISKAFADGCDSIGLHLMRMFFDRWERWREPLLPADETSRFVDCVFYRFSSSKSSSEFLATVLLTFRVYMREFSRLSGMLGFYVLTSLIYGSCRDWYGEKVS